MVSFSNKFEELSNRIFQTLKGYGYSIKTYDSSGNKTVNPLEAKYFYTTPGKMLISIHEVKGNNEIKVYLGIDQDIKNIKKLLSNLRKTAVNFNLFFTVRKYNKKITPKDFAFNINMNSLDETLENSYSFLKELL